jgi:cytochrome c553
MLERWKKLKRGEKILFGVVVLLIVVTVQNYAYLEYLRRSSDRPMFPVRTHYDFAGEGFRGSELFRKNNCIACHRAVGNGTSMGLNLDGIGSRRTLAYLESFLSDPEATYPSRTVDHGPSPKEAAYVANLSSDDRRAIAIFLSQLTADRGGTAAQQPPTGKSSFIDAMLDMWAPDTWRMAFTDVRDKDVSKKEPGAAAAGTQPAPKDASHGP